MWDQAHNHVEQERDPGINVMSNDQDQVSYSNHVEQERDPGINVMSNDQDQVSYSVLEWRFFLRAHLHKSKLLKVTGYPYIGIGVNLTLTQFQSTIRMTGGETTQ